MKKLLLAIAVLSGLFASAQISNVPGYAGRNTRDHVIATMADSGLHVPAFAIPRIASGIGVRSGGLFVDTVGGGKGLYYVVGGVMTRLADTTELGAAGLTDGDYGDIVVSGTGTVMTVGVNKVTGTKFRQSAGLSVVGNPSNTTDDVLDITASNDGNVLRRFGTSLGFGAINLASSNAVTGILPIANIATGTPTGSKFVRDDGTLAVPSGSGTTDHTALSNLGWTTSGHTGTANRVAAFNGSGATSYLQVGVDLQAYNSALAQIVGLSPSNDDFLQLKGSVWTNRTVAQVKSDLQVPSLVPGTNITITGTALNPIINTSGDTTEANVLDYGAIADDGLTDTVAFKAAAATGKNVFVPQGEFLVDVYRIPLAKGQRVRGVGLNSRIRFTKDTCDVFYVPNDSCYIRDLYFIGKGRGSYPGGETFTYSNAIYLGGNSNTVENCYFKNVKGSAITSWAGSTIYNNSVKGCSGDSNTIGVYLVLNSEYGRHINNTFDHSIAAFVERCSGNNTWIGVNGDYCTYGFRLKSPGGCNGDHGSVSHGKFNHCVNVIDISETANEYLFDDIKGYSGAWNIGTTDTARQVTFQNCVASSGTITTTKAKNCKWTGGSFGPNNSPDVVVTGTTGIEFCSVMNSPYQSTTCGGGASLTNPMTTADDIIIGGVGGSPARLAKGSNGTFLGVDGSGVLGYHTLSGGGDVTKVGTPANTEVAVWTGDGTLGRRSGFTDDGTTLNYTGAAVVSTSVRSPLYIGTTGTTDGIIMKATTGVGTGANPAFIFQGANNGATQFMRIDHNGTFGIGTNPSSSFKLFMVSLAATNSTGWALIRNSSSQNIFQGADNGDTKIGNQSVSTSVNYLLNKNWIGVGLTTPTAFADIDAGVTANASLRIRDGVAPTSPNAGDIWRATFLKTYQSSAIKRFVVSNDATPSNGQIPIGNGTDYTLANITSPNSTITVTNGSGTIGVDIPTTVLTSGTYTPTVTEVTNGGGAGFSVGYTCQYMRVGDVVTVSGKIDIDPSVPGLTEVRVSLPIASAITADQQVGGTGVDAAGWDAWKIKADVTNDAAIFSTSALSSALNTVHFSFTYLVL